MASQTYVSFNLKAAHVQIALQRTSNACIAQLEVHALCQSIPLQANIVAERDISAGHRDEIEKLNARLNATNETLRSTEDTLQSTLNKLQLTEETLQKSREQRAADAEANRDEMKKCNDDWQRRFTILQGACLAWKWCMMMMIGDYDVVLGT